MTTYTIIFVKYIYNIYSFALLKLKVLKVKIMNNCTPLEKLRYPEAFAVSSPSNDPKHKKHWILENLRQFR